MVTVQPGQSQVLAEPNPCNHLVDLVDITISDQSKESQALTHRETINQWVKERSLIDDKIIVYSDGSQSEKGYILRSNWL